MPSRLLQSSLSLQCPFSLSIKHPFHHLPYFQTLNIPYQPPVWLCLFLFTTFFLPFPFCPIPFFFPSPLWFLFLLLAYSLCSPGWHRLYYPESFPAPVLQASSPRQGTGSPYVLQVKWFPQPPKRSSDVTCSAKLPYPTPSAFPSSAQPAPIPLSIPGLFRSSVFTAVSCSDLLNYHNKWA